LPRAFVDTAYVRPTGQTIAVPAGGNLQAALNAAQPGDTITLAPGAVYAGPFELPNKPGSRWITVRTAVPDGVFPPPGTRVKPSDAKLMPRLVASSGSGPVLATAHAAHHYRLVGLEISPTPDTFLYALVSLDSPDGSAAGLPHSIIIDRCFLHGDSRKGTRRGIALNSGAAAVINSHLSDFKEVGADTQAVVGWAGPGPFRIANNYLEAAGENLMFGGADPSIRDLVPSDIEIVRNHFSKPLTWKIGDPSYAGTPWGVKNILELKNARRVLIEGNLLERNWAHLQNGFAVLFTVSNQTGTAPWSAVQDVTFRYNVVRSSGSGFNITGHDYYSPSQRTSRIWIHDNLITDIDQSRWGGGGRLFQLLWGTEDVVIEHNTSRQTGTVIMAEGDPHENFVFRYNIAPHNAYGVTGTGTGPGSSTFAQYFPGIVFDGNVLSGQPTLAKRYPPSNYFPDTLEGVGFVDLASGDYRLSSSSPYRGVTPGGLDVGVDVQKLGPAMGWVGVPD
jgi:hypothetical protein